MDYCHSCRRHLNGALACAGCGVPVGELGHAAPETPAEHDDRRPHYDGSAGAAAPAAAPAPDAAPPGPAASPIPSPGPSPGPSPEPRPGRAAARRAKTAGRGTRIARAAAGAHRRRGRKVFLVCMGLVLAGGALSLAELAQESVGDSRAAGSAQDDGEGDPSRWPSPTGDVQPTGGGTGTPQVDRAAAERTSSSPSKSGSPSAEASKSPSKKATPTTTDASRAPDPVSGGAPSQDGGSAPSAPAPAPPPPPPASSSDPGPRPAPTPTPTPTPTETCDRFLWWCA